jgi:hypothetical protein
MRRLVYRSIVVLVMLGSIVTLSQSPSVCAFGFCEGCIWQCHEESTQIYIRCTSSGEKSAMSCIEEQRQYEATCASIFCPFCTPH